MKFDLHVHTKLSYDSVMTTTELYDAAVKKGLSGVAVADHNAFLAHTPRENFFFINASEVSTDAGHLLILFQKNEIPPNIATDENGRYFWRDVCDAAHKDGALVFLAHPFAPEFPRSARFWKEIDGIEVANSRAALSRVSDANERAIKLAGELSLPFSAGSDAHCPEEVGTSFWECDLPESAMDEPDFEEKLKELIKSGSGKVFSGNAAPYAVFKCKKKTKRSLRGQLKNYAFLVLSFLKRKKESGAYIDMTK